MKDFLSRDYSARQCQASWDRFAKLTQYGLRPVSIRAFSETLMLNLGLTNNRTSLANSNVLSSRSYVLFPVNFFFLLSFDYWVLFGIFDLAHRQAQGKNLRFLFLELYQQTITDQSAESARNIGTLIAPGCRELFKHHPANVMRIWFHELPAFC